MGVFLLKPEIKSIVFRIANMHRLLGAGAGAVSWLCTWWRQVAGAGGVACICEGVYFRICFKKQ